MKKTACEKSWEAINKNPTAAPAHAPNNGIKAVNPMNVPIVSANGKRNNSIPTPHKVPKITASNVCPTKNPEKLWSVISKSVATRLYVLGDKNALPSVLICFVKRSFPNKRYIANEKAITNENNAVVAPPTTCITDDNNWFTLVVAKFKIRWL